MRSPPNLASAELCWLRPCQQATEALLLSHLLTSPILQSSLISLASCSFRGTDLNVSVKLLCILGLPTTTVGGHLLPLVRCRHGKKRDARLHTSLPWSRPSPVLAGLFTPWGRLHKQRPPQTALLLLCLPTSAPALPPAQAGLPGGAQQRRPHSCGAEAVGLTTKAVAAAAPRGRLPLG